MTLLHQFKTEQIITVLSKFTWTNQWWNEYSISEKTFEKVILDTTMHGCLKQFWTDIKNYHGVKKIHGFSRIPIVMVLISHCTILRNNQRISNETFLKTNDIIKNGLNFPEE